MDRTFRLACEWQALLTGMDRLAVDTTQPGQDA